MKKIVLSIATGLMFASCGSIKTQLIGELNIISTRNFSTKENYVNIKSYAGSSKKELKRNKANTIDGACSNLMRTVPGGEFIQNAKIYLVDHKYYAVEGDIWGAETQNFKGFKVGDRVMWKDLGLKYKGVITDLKNEKEATVKQDENGKIRVVDYDEMNKI